MSKPILSEGYGIMPNVILFDKELSSTAKLLFCYLSSLAANTGSCRPRNTHLCNKFDLKPRQMANLMTELEPYIFRSEDEQGRRIISLTSVINRGEGGCNKLQGGMQKIAPHSNINSTVKEDTSETQASIEKVYKVWLVYMVIDPEVRATTDPEVRRAAYLQAKKHTRLTDKRKAKIASRLADAGEAMLVKAIKNLSESPFHKGENESNWKADIEFICRSYEKVEEWANK